MKTASYIFQTKRGGKWTTTHTCTDSATAYEELSHELISKKLCNASYIRAIKREQHYTHVDITVTYANDCGGGRRIYTIQA